MMLLAAAALDIASDVFFLKVVNTIGQAVDIPYRLYAPFVPAPPIPTLSCLVEVSISYPAAWRRECPFTSCGL